MNPPIIFVPPRRSVERRGLMWEYQVLEPITDLSRGSFGWVGRRWTRRGAEKAANRLEAQFSGGVTWVGVSEVEG